MIVFSHLGFEEYFTMGVIGAFALTPFISVAIQNTIDKLKYKNMRRKKPHTLLRDGVFVMHFGTTYDLLEYFHKAHSFSMDFALKYEGYELQFKHFSKSDI